tara:strand:- start:5404 stop:5973 length:570 start_codon:yes stop_codon:yes gene_type:complete
VQDAALAFARCHEANDLGDKALERFFEAVLIADVNGVTADEFIPLWIVLVETYTGPFGAVCIDLYGHNVARFLVFTHDISTFVAQDVICELCARTWTDFKKLRQSAVPNDRDGKNEKPIARSIQVHGVVSLLVERCHHLSYECFLLNAFYRQYRLKFFHLAIVIIFKYSFPRVDQIEKNNKYVARNQKS